MTSIPAITLIGGGQMGRALAGGMIRSGVLPESRLTVIETSDQSRDWWKLHHAKAHIPADGHVPAADPDRDRDVVILAVKPGVIGEAARQHARRLENRLVVSIAAGVTLDSLIASIGHDRVVRVMPNTPSLVGHGASGFCCGPAVSDSDRHLVDAIFSAVGLCRQVTESQMDAVTALSGSGQAYVFLMIEAMADGGVLAGLPRPLAIELATQTVLGAAAMVQQTGQHPGQLKDGVASPAGTTIAAIGSLEQNGFRGAVIQAIAAAARRSCEMRSSS